MSKYLNGKKKILMISTMYGEDSRGGSEISLKILVEYLVKKNFDVTVLALTPCKSEYTEIINGVKVYFAPIKNLFWPFDPNFEISRLKRVVWHLFDCYNVLYRPTFQRIFQTERPDLVHTHVLPGFSIYAWSFFHKMRLPVVHTLREYYSICHGLTCYRHNQVCKQLCLQCYFVSRLKKPFSNELSAVVGISHFILDKHLKNNIFKNVPVKKVIYNPISLSQDTLSEKAIYKTGKVLALGFLGSVVPIKGVDLIIRSCLNNDISRKVKILIGGPGEDKYISYLKSIATNLDCEFLGFTKPAEFFPKIDILIVPSLHPEPFGRVVVEALAFGVPVIGSKRGGIPELIEPGKVGWLFETLQDLTKLLEEILAGKYDIVMMSQNALRESKKYMPEQVCEEYVRLYQQVFNERVKSPLQENS